MCLYFLLFLSFVHWPLLRLDVSFIIWYHFIIYYSFYSILFCFISFYSILFIFLFHLKFHFVSFNFILLYIISFYFRGKIWKSGTPSPLIILGPPPLDFSHFFGTFCLWTASLTLRKLSVILLSHAVWNISYKVDTCANIPDLSLIVICPRLQTTMLALMPIYLFLSCVMCVHKYCTLAHGCTLHMYCTV